MWNTVSLKCVLDCLFIINETSRINKRTNFNICLLFHENVTIKPSRDSLEASILGRINLRIGELADIAGVSKRTIDYYTNLNLLKPARSDTGYRIFELSDVEKLNQISHLKEKGFSLEEIKEKLAFPDSSEQVLEKALLIKNDLQELLDLLKRTDQENSSIKESITHDTLPVIQALLQLLI